MRVEGSKKEGWSHFSEARRWNLLLARCGQSEGEKVAGGKRRRRQEREPQGRRWWGRWPDNKHVIGDRQTEGGGKGLAGRGQRAVAVAVAGMFNSGGKERSGN